jgi:BON domain
VNKLHSRRPGVGGGLEPVPHGLEQRVHRELCRHGGIAYSSVVVRRLPNGVCLEGVVRADSALFDASQAALEVPGVREVLNHLVHCTECTEALAECR